MASKPDALDTLIEDTARQMTAGDPGAAFTSNVLARLASGARPVQSWRPARSWRPALAGLSAAALFVVAAVVYRSHIPTEPGAQTVRLTPDTTRPSDVRLKPDATSSSDVRLKPDATSSSDVRLKPDATRRVARALQASDPIPSGIDALTVPSIAIAHIASTPLSPVDSLDLDPLTIAPINVTPLDSGDDIQRRFE